jgi:hypothetical protein
MDTLTITAVVTEVVGIVSEYWMFIGAGVVVAAAGGLFRKFTATGR